MTRKIIKFQREQLFTRYSNQKLLLSFFVVYTQYVCFEYYVHSRGISTMYVILLHPHVSVYSTLHMQYSTLSTDSQSLLWTQSSIYKKEIHNFLAEVRFKPGSSDLETYALIMSYQTVDEGTTSVEEFKACCEEAQSFN